ncbi:hypothetical protein [Luteolibacter sp. Populi]|uniref:hypothetical protein n=1 Tax=Luteolibacter sp. Populi TaxID=3230487 RepID=UPI00346797DE
MKAMRQLPLLAASFAVAAVGGWLAAGRGEALPVTDLAAPAKSPDRKRIPGSAREMPPEVVARLATVRAAGTPDERLRAMTLLAQSLPVSELAAWYEAGWIPRRQTVDSLQFYHITGKRWLAEDGEGMVRYHLAKDRNRLADACSDWGWQDPTAAFKLLDETKDPQDFGLLVSALAGSAAKGDPPQGLARILRYEAALKENLRSSGADFMIDWIALEAPELLERESIGWPDRLRKRALFEITQNSLKKDFAGAVADLAGKADGKEKFLAAAVSWELKDQLAAHLDKLPEGWLPALLDSRNGNHLVRDNPDRWFDADYAGMGISEKKARELRAAAAKEMAYRNPERLPEILAADLEPAARDNLIRACLTRLQTADPAKAVQMRDHIGLAPDMDGLWGKVVAEAPSQGPLKRLDSPSQIGELAKWSRDDKSFAISGMQAWDEGEIQQAIKALGSLPAEDRRVLVDTLTDTDSPGLLRAESIRYLIEDQGGAPVNERRLRESCRFASDWGVREPRAAARWVESLPDGESRLWMAKNVAAAWGNYDPQGAAKWVDSLGLKEKLDGLGKEE